VKDFRVPPASRMNEIKETVRQNLMCLVVWVLSLYSLWLCVFDVVDTFINAPKMIGI
jgi:hypothetical protein